MDLHLDMNTEIQNLIKAQEDSLAFRAICQGDKAAMAKLRNHSDAGSAQVLEKAVRERKDTPFGQAQVQSFLRFMVSNETTLALEDAERDNMVYDALGDHRVLGKPKKKKRRVVSY